MVEVKILIEGFTSADNGQGLTCPTITLIRDKDIIMVVDPGVLESQQVLVDALSKEGLKVSDITHVFITHSHIDHYRNIGMFPLAKTVEYYGVWQGQKAYNWNEQFSSNLKIIKTPGHSYDSLSLLVETELGKIAVVGDVFWKEDEPKQDPYASDKKELKKSREKILALSDYVVPGHGFMFKVKKD